MEPQQTSQPNTAPQTTAPTSGLQDPAAMGMPMTPAPIQDGSPYFAGGHAVIKFSTGEPGYGPETFWLVDKQQKTITPFSSPTSLQAVFGPDFQQVMSSVVTVMPPNVSPDGKVNNGVLTGFYILDPEYSIREDGSSKPVDFTPGHLTHRYGRPINEVAEQDAIKKLDDTINGLKVHGQSHNIQPAYLDKLIKDSKLMAFYINALAYGDYEANDIVVDILRRYHLAGEHKKGTNQA